MIKGYRTVPADEVLSSLPPERQKKIDARAAELIAEEFALRELWEAKQMTQEDVARKLGGRQVYVSVFRLENRAEMKLSTPREYVGAIGGMLELVVSFPKSRGVKLADLGSSPYRPARSRPVAARKKPARQTDKRT